MLYGFKYFHLILIIFNGSIWIITGAISLCLSGPKSNERVTPLFPRLQNWMQFSVIYRIKHLIVLQALYKDGSINLQFDTTEFHDKNFTVYTLQALSDIVDIFCLYPNTTTFRYSSLDPSSFQRRICIFCINEIHFHILSAEFSNPSLSPEILILHNPESFTPKLQTNYIQWI